MINMNKASLKISVFLILLVSVFSVSAKETYQDLFIKSTVNTVTEHPGGLFNDNRAHTWSSFLDNETQGSYEIRFTDNQVLRGLRVKAEIPEGISVGMEYEKDGIRYPFYSSYATAIEADEWFYIDVSREKIETDKVFLNVRGDNIGAAKFYEVEVFGYPSEKLLQKKALKPVESGSNSSYYTSEHHLVDGLSGTYWEVMEPENWSNIHWAVLEGLKKRFSFTRKWSRWKTSYAVLEPVDSYDVRQLKLYVTEQGSGSLNLKIKSGGKWHSLSDLNLSKTRGWLSWDLAEYNNRLEQIRLEISGWETAYGGIGEVEILDDRYFETAMSDPLIPFQNTAAGENEGFFTLEEVKETDFYTLHTALVVPDSESDIECRLNGKTLENEESYARNNIRYIDYALTPADLWQNENFVIYNFPEGIRLLGASLEKETRGEIPFLKEDLVCGDLLTLGEKAAGNAGLVSLHGTADIDRILILTEGDTLPTKVFTISGEVRSELELLSTGDEFALYKGAGEADAVGFAGCADLCEIEIQGSRIKSPEPYIQILYPEPDRAFLNHEPTYRVVYGITDSPDSEIRINGEKAKIKGNIFWQELQNIDFEDWDDGDWFESDCSGENRYYSFNYNETGEQVLVARIKDENGGLAEYQQRLNFGLNNYNLQVYQEDKVYYTRENTFLVSGRANYYRVKLLINDEEVEIRRQQFSHKAKLEAGMNLVEIAFYDSNSGDLVQYIVRRVYYNTSDLNIKINSPGDGQYYNADSLPVSGQISGAGVERVTINGVPASLSGSRFVSRRDVALPEQENTITVTATDNTGFSSTKTIIVRTDRTPPELADIEPVNDSWFAYKDIEFTGWVYDETAVSIYVNDYLATVNDTFFRVVVPLVERDNDIHVVGVDAAGNRTFNEVFNINIDTTPPESFLPQADPSGWTNNQRPIVEFDTYDTGVGFSHFEISIKGREFNTQVSPYQLPFQEDGTNQIDVKAFDLLGNNRTETTYVYIDTIPPDDPEGFRAVSGKDLISLRWFETDDETKEYIIHQVGTPRSTDITIPREQGVLQESELGNTLNFEYDAEGLEIGSEYEFEIQAIDRAGNEGDIISASAVTGLVTVEVEEGIGVILEYDTAGLLVGKDNIPEGISEIILHEEESFQFAEVSNSEIIGSVYNFEIKDESGEIQDHVGFEDSYVGYFEFEESELPDGFPEQNLGVYYFDPEWGIWTKVPDSLVDTESNRVYFAANHFSSFSVQPTPSVEVSPQDILDIEFSPFSDRIVHAPLSVSTQGGGLSTYMTEMVLPGKNGLDLEIRRLYDSGTALADSSGLFINKSQNINELAQLFASITDYQKLSRKANEYLRDGNVVVDEDTVKQSLVSIRKRGDYALTLGMGWRLNFPYMTNGYSQSHYSIRVPSGSVYQIKDMESEGTVKGNDCAEGGNTRTLRYINYDREYFTLDVDQSYSSKLESWRMTRAELKMPDGMFYSFNRTGQILSISDPTENHTIQFAYSGNPDKNEMDADLKEKYEEYDETPPPAYYSGLIESITDSYGRKLIFSYCLDRKGAGYYPISSIELEGSGRTVSYEYEFDDSNNQDTDYKEVPFLSKSVDTGGREWIYEKDDIYIFTGTFGGKSDGIGAISQAVSDSMNPGSAEFLRSFNLFGWGNSTSTSIQSNWFFPIKSIRGSGIGLSEVEYSITPLQYMCGSDYYSYSQKTVVSAVTKKQIWGGGRTGTEEKGNTSQRTDYSYNFEHADYSQFYNSHTIVNNGKIRTDHFFSKIEEPYAESDTLLDSFMNWLNGSDEKRIITPLEKEIKVTKLSDNSVFEITKKEYTESMLPKQIVSFRYGGNDSSTVNYRYDLKNNKIYIGRIDKVNDWESRSETWHYYANTEYVDGVNNFMSSDDILKTSDIKGGSPNENICSLPLKTKIANYYDGSVLQNLYTTNQYNSEGQVTAQQRWNGEEWETTVFSYYPDSGYEAAFLKEKIEVRGDLITTSIGSFSVIHTGKGHRQSYTYSLSGTDYYTKTITEKDVLDADGNSSDISRNEVFDYYSGNRITQTDGRGYSTSYEYDSLDRITKITRPDESDNHPVTVLSYADSSSGSFLREKKPEGSETTYDFDLSGNLREKIVYNRFDANGGTVSNPGSLNNAVVTLIKYDGYNNATELTDPEGNVTSFEYDDLNRIAKKTSPSDEHSDKTPVKSYRYVDKSHTTEETDESGNTTSSIRDYKGNLLSVTRESNTDQTVSSEAWYFDGLGRQVKRVDGNNNEFKSEYDSIGRLVKSINSLSTTEIIYALNGAKEKEITSGAGDFETTTEYETDGLKRIVKQTTSYIEGISGEEKSDIVSYYYDGQNNLIKTTHGSISTGTEYSARGQVIAEIDGAGNRTTYFFDRQDRLVSMTDPRGNSGNYAGLDFSINYQYDDLDRLIKGEMPKNNGASTKPSVLLKYDMNGNLTSRTETDGSSISYEYSPRNYLIKETRSGNDIEGSVKTYITKYTYDSIGNLKKTTLPDSSEINHSYDMRGLLTSESYADGGELSQIFDGNGNLKSSTSPVGGTTLYEYNTLNLPTKQTQPEGEIYEYSYNAQGLQTESKDGRNVKIETEYDTLGRMISNTNSAAEKTLYKYDTNGFLVEAKDARGTVVSYTNDNRGLPTHIEYENGSTTETIVNNYDEAGELKSSSNNGVLNKFNMSSDGYRPDPYGLIWNESTVVSGQTMNASYSYDEMNRLTQVNDKDSFKTIYQINQLGETESVNGLIDSIEYNTAGLPSLIEYANTMTSTRHYDNRQRMSYLDYWTDGDKLPHKDYTFIYDTSGNIIKKGPDKFCYDRNGRLISAIITSGAGEDLIKLPDGKYEKGFVNKDYIGQNEFQLSEDKISMESGASSLSFDLGYGYNVKKIVLKPADLHNFPSRYFTMYLSLYNREDYYEEAEKLTVTVNEETGEIELKLKEAQYARFVKVHCHLNPMDAEGEPIIASEDDQKVLIESKDQIEIHYVSAGRFEMYGYDKSNNRKNRMVIQGANDPENSSYVYKTGTNLLESDGTYAYQYDKNGNMIDKYFAGEYYSDEQKEADEDLVDLEREHYKYYYDLQNRLVKVEKLTSYDPETKTEIYLTTTYTYDSRGYRVKKNSSDYYQYDMSGNVLNDSNWHYSYLNGQHIARRNDTTTQWYGTDHLGSTVLITDSEGNDIWNGERTPFGDFGEDSDSNDSETVKFTGKEWDDDAGLYYYNARWYDANSGRFTSEDPIRDGLNYYVYVNNNPVNFTDPTGLWTNNEDGSFTAQEGDTLGGLEKETGREWGETGFDREPETLQVGETVSFDNYSPQEDNPTIDSTGEAIDHYYNGDGESVNLGSNSQDALKNNPDQQYRRGRIISGQTSSNEGNYGVDMTGDVYHIGDTVVEYKSTTGSKYTVTTYTGFAKDGFWDVLPGKGDSKGPSKELPGGTPYSYNTYSWTETTPKVEE